MTGALPVWFSNESADLWKSLIILTDGLNLGKYLLSSRGILDLAMPGYLPGECLQTVVDKRSRFNGAVFEQQ
jgi:hypothetical protein